MHIRTSLIALLVTATSLVATAPRVAADAIRYNITNLGEASPIDVNNQGQVSLGLPAGYDDTDEGYTNLSFYPVPLNIYNSFGPNAGVLTSPPALAQGPGSGNGPTVPWVNDQGESAGVDSNLNAYVSGGGVPLTQVGPSFSNGDVWVHPQAINDAGQVVGNAAFPGSNGIHAFLFSGGQVTDLGTLGDLTPGNLSVATSINGQGTIVGFSETPADSTNTQGPVHAFVDQNGVMTDLTPALGFNWSRAYGINSQGVIVGDMSPGFYGPWHAFMLVNGQVTDLNSLLPPSSGWTLFAATGINDVGQIVGEGYHDGLYVGFLLTPSALGDPPDVAVIPEPAPVICFAALFAVTLVRGTIAARRALRA